MATPQELQHHYPPQVHLLDHPLLQTLVARASTPDTTQPAFNHLIRQIYLELFSWVMNREWPTEEWQTPTRMSLEHPEQKLKAQVFKAQQKAVIVDIARAGMLPSQIFFDSLNQITDPTIHRLDHVFASRISNANDQVSHTEIQSSKVGGGVDKALVFLPDPMGATGHSLSEVVDFYKRQEMGQADRFISVHMIITPEFIRHVTQRHPDVQIYSVRLDRGFSTPQALQHPPGFLWDQEKGLNDRQYIVPGAGGVGELINNSFV